MLGIKTGGFVTEYIQSETTNSILEITFNRLERKNALNQAMYARLSELINGISGDSGIRAILITGQPECFTSGNDLGDFATHGANMGEDSDVLTFMRTLRNCPVPVVAAVDGIAIGIGTTILLHCDLIYASPRAMFCMPFARLGLCPEYASSYLIPRIAGHVKATEWLMLGEPFSAEDALQANLINEVVDNPLERAREQANKIVHQAPAVIRKTKELIQAGYNENIDCAMKREVQAFMQALTSEEFAEAVSAFFEKRAPDFSKFD